MGLYVKNIVLFVLIVAICEVLLFYKYELIIEYLHVTNTCGKYFFIITFAMFSILGYSKMIKEEAYYDSVVSKEEISQVLLIEKQEKSSKYTNCYIARICDFENNMNNEINNQFSGSSYKKAKVTNKKVKLYISKNEEVLNNGAIVIAKGKFVKPQSKRNEGGFDYRNYLKQKRIIGNLYCNNIKYEDTIYINKLDSLYVFLNKQISDLHTNLKQRIENSYCAEVSGFLNGILLADTNELEDTIKSDFKNANLSHILAISGMHVTYVVALVESALNFIHFKNYRIGKVSKHIFISCFLGFFLIITDFPVSAIRACICEILVLIAFVFRRKSNFLNSLCFSMLIILLINPYNLQNVGMWLSYMGTIGLVVFNRFFEKRIKLKIKHSIKASIITSISVQILIFPIMWYSFGNLSLVFIISNLLIGNVIGFAIVLGYLSIIESLINLRIISMCNQLLIIIILKVVKICGSFKYANISLTKPNFGLVIAYYTIVVAIIIVSNSSINFKFFRFIKLHKKYIKRIVIINLIIVLTTTQINIKLNKNVRIYFLDVGQGDCTVAILPDNKVLVIDCGEGGKEGEYDYGEKVVYPFLLEHRIRKIDYLIFSHTDLDHCGGGMFLIENMQVKNIILGFQTSDFENTKRIKELANKNKIPMYELGTYQSINLGKYTKINVLWPNKNSIISDNEINNESLVFNLESNGINILFTGDIEKEAEDRLIENLKQNNMLEFLKADILKVAHHGSKTSSTSEFIQLVNPKICLIGVGENNKFNHPSEEVIERFARFNIKVYRTDLYGEIQIKANSYGNCMVQTLLN